MSRYGEIVNPRKTPQREKAREDQVMNNAEGAVFAVGPWVQLDRFLILGQEGPTYYASERKVVKDNVAALRKCLAEDGPRAVRRIVEISDAGRAPKNDPAVFALAVAAGDPNPATRRAAQEALPRVCRIGTHLFHFAADVQNFRRWGRGLRGAVARWYTERKEDDLAMQALKYQQRDGWSHRDLLRLSHPKAKTPRQDATLRWMVGGKEAVDAVGRTRGKEKAPVAPLREFLHPLLAAFDELHAAKEKRDVVRLISEHRLPREAVPTEWLNDADVWATLLPHMGPTAMIRNLGKMTAVGLLKPLSEHARRVADAVSDEQVLRKARVHPMQLLLALGVYRRGKGEKGKLEWKTVPAVVDALDAGFYASFKGVEPTGKKTLIALDVSGSMDGGTIAGAPGITPRVASAAMAMVTARVEKNWHVVGFTSSSGYGGGYGGKWGGPPSGLTDVDISPSQRLDDVCATVSALPMGGTDCALPMLHAAAKELEVDVFQIYTDNETWAGNVHPFQALRDYRRKSGRNAKLVVCGLTATNFTIADPSDPGMLDVVGMDAHAPAIMADFARGEV